MMTNPNEPASPSNRLPRCSLGGGGSPWRRIFCSLFFVAAAIALVAAVVSSRAVGQRVEVPSQRAFHPAPVQKIAPWVVEHTANGQQTEFFVVLADQADLSPAVNLPTKTEKGRFVYQTLLSTAQTTQAPILQWLRERNIEHQSFYIVNAILVKGHSRDCRRIGCSPGRGAHRRQPAHQKFSSATRGC
jgi:hypothetical protein